MINPNKKSAATKDTNSIAFIRETSPRCTAHTVNSGGRSIAREYGWPDYLPQEKVIAPVDPKIFDDYVGQYQSAPSRIITITNENGKLMAQMSAGAKAELFAESETDFFLKLAAVQIKFVKDTQGKVTGLVLRQGEREIRAQKVK